jgi:hypothetical protein
MQWNKAKDSDLEFDWRCETPYWSFKIIKLDKNNYALYNTKPLEQLIRISKNIQELYWDAFNLNLRAERIKDEFR